MHKTGAFIFGNQYFQHGFPFAYNSLKTNDTTNGSKALIGHVRWPSIQVGGAPGAGAPNSSEDTDAEVYNVLLKNAKTPTQKEIE